MSADAEPKKPKRESKPAPIYSPTRRLITPAMLAQKGITFHLDHLRRLWKQGDFPTPIHVSANRIAWPEDVLDAWIKQKEQQR